MPDAGMKMLTPIIPTLPEKECQGPGPTHYCGWESFLSTTDGVYSTSRVYAIMISAGSWS